MPKKRGRRGNGEGSIYRRKSGRWVGQYAAETPDGSAKRKTVYGRTRAEAAAKLFQDIEAVAAAMVWPYSQGQTEGRINKLKLIKRSMYGRGKFDLLKQRVLYAATG